MTPQNVVVLIAFALMILSIIFAVARNTVLDPTYLAVLSAVWLYVVGSVVGVIK